MAASRFMTDEKYLERRTKAQFAIQMLCGIQYIDTIIIEVVEDMVKIMQSADDVPVRAIDALCNIANHVRWCADEIITWREERGLPTEIDDDEDGKVFQYPVPVPAPAKPVRGPRLALDELSRALRSEREPDEA